LRFARRIAVVVVSRSIEEMFTYHSGALPGSDANAETLSTGRSMVISVTLMPSPLARDRPW